MASHLDLEEQEQLDQLKAFWAQYGNLISWVLIAVFGSVAAWNGWQYWQRSQAAQAAVMYDEVERAAQAGDVTRLERSVADMKERFARTTYAAQAASLAAKGFYDAGKPDLAKKELTWVSENSADDGYKAMAKLRLAGLLLDTKAYDEALKLLSGDFPPEHAAMVADRKGDVLLAQGKRAEAKAEFEKAYKTFDQRVEYRRLVEVKLNSLGADPAAAVNPIAAAPPEATAPSAAPASGVK
jgi:predicted negative regulator of RcsB-dependent stress response